MPFILSFDKKLQFYKQWKYLLPSIIIIALFYLVGDIYFTKLGIWGFNENHLSSIFLFKLPIEEWLFFLAIPYASIFLHDVLHVYFPKFKLTPRKSRNVSIILLFISMGILLLNLDKAYTTYIFWIFIVIIIISYFDKSNTINRFYCTFLIILIPFILVNGLLTGAFTAEPVVWYDDSQNLNLRLLTIPIEDFIYGFTMLLAAIMLRNRLKKVQV